MTASKTASFNKISLFSCTYAMGAAWNYTQFVDGRPNPNYRNFDQWKTIGDAEALNPEQYSNLATAKDAHRHHVGYDPDNVGEFEQSFDRNNTKGNKGLNKGNKGLNKGKGKGKGNKGQIRERGLKRRNTNKYFEAKAERSRRSQRKSVREGKLRVRLVDLLDINHQDTYTNNLVNQPPYTCVVDSSKTTCACVCDCDCYDDGDYGYYAVDYPSIGQIDLV